MDEKQQKDVAADEIPRLGKRTSKAFDHVIQQITDGDKPQLDVAAFTSSL